MIASNKRPKTAIAKKALNKKGEKIEDRLMEQKKKYDERAEQLKRERLMEEMSEVREVPQINHNYTQRDEYGQELRVEDRLLNIGKMWKERKERMIVESFDSVAQ